MHPAYSVILFTTASGAGYGLLALLGLVGLAHGPASSFWFGAGALFAGLGLVVAGLVSSTFHLGHPERAWRALSQWRSSWLSREAVAALLSFLPALAFAALWLSPQSPRFWLGLAGLLMALSSLATVYCTAMIYRCLVTIRQWNNPLVVPVYLAFSLATGGGVLLALAHVAGRGQPVQAAIAALAIALAAGLKIAYWRGLDRQSGPHTIAGATGLGALGPVRQLEAPHTAANYLNREMGYRIARDHRQTLRRFVALCLGLAFVLALAVALVFTGPLATLCACACALAAALAALVERWLFFAEAEHVVNLYYGRQTA